jgi:flagellar biosynthesis chaperone FliJ
MAFRFPLATVLRVREIAKTREERALQRIQVEIARTMRQIEEINRLIAQAHAARAEALRTTMTAGQLQAMVLEAEAGAQQEIALQATLSGLHQQRDEQLKVYQASHRDHEMILNMKHAQREAYDQEQTRIQQKNLDDIFIARRQRN